MGTIINRKAYHDYEVLITYVAGLCLMGSEVKSIKLGKANIRDSYCYIDKNNEVWLKNAHISKYDSDKFTNHEELRDRKLLLTKKEIRKIKALSQIKGNTIIPLKIFLHKGLIKIEIGLCKGKKLYDKRESLKEKDDNRNIDRLTKNNYER
jgi:SsrA-binding protein